MTNLIPVLDSKIPIRGPKYRQLIDEVLKYFEDHSDVKIVKVVFETGHKADLAATKCRLHLRPNENLKIIRRKNEVFFLREGSL